MRTEGCRDIIQEMGDEAHTCNVTVHAVYRHELLICQKAGVTASEMVTVHSLALYIVFLSCSRQQLGLCGLHMRGECKGGDPITILLPIKTFRKKNNHAGTVQRPSIELYSIHFR